jgi:allophanate hydrolase subunit 2
MGVRMEGSYIEGKGKNDIISDGIVFGSVQITSAGQPIVMMADHQTTGGYAKIATVIKEDLPKLAQARPGSHVRFEKVEIESLQKSGIFRLVRKI